MENYIQFSIDAHVLATVATGQVLRLRGRVRFYRLNFPNFVWTLFLICTGKSD